MKKNLSLSNSSIPISTSGDLITNITTFNSSGTSTLPTILSIQNDIQLDGAIPAISPADPKNVNDIEFAGGEDNLIAISLKNKDYTSADHHDYLQYGLNAINIAITPNCTNNNFVMRTLAVG